MRLLKRSIAVIPMVLLVIGLIVTASRSASSAPQQQTLSDLLKAEVGNCLVVVPAASSLNPGTLDKVGPDYIQMTIAAIQVTIVTSQIVFFAATTGCS